MSATRKILALPWYGEGVEPCEPVVICGTCAMGQKTIENAGRAFWDRHEFPLFAAATSNNTPTADKSSKVKVEKTESERERLLREKREKKANDVKSKDGGLLKMSEDLKDKCLYKILEVDVGFTADDLKKSYRNLVLKHHPDKIPDATEKQRKHFLNIQEAFEILNDEGKKRRYESTLDFDDSIPDDFKKGSDAEEFFETFGPCFKRNARWSNRTPVPKLGDEKTPIEDVKKFYDFWYSFDSWRDPLAMAEKDDVELHNYEQADCREERRWMERENARVAKNIAKEEKERITELVKISERCDPRMIAHRAAAQAKRDAEKAERQAAKDADRLKKEAEEAAQAKAEEEARLVEEAKRQEARKAKEGERQAVKAARQRVRNLHKNAAASLRRAVHADQLQQVCLALPVPELEELYKKLQVALGKVVAKEDSAEDNESGDGDAVEYPEAVELLHAEIIKSGATPVEDTSVHTRGPGSDSTALPESANEEEEVVPVREMTKEEKKEERLRLQAEEAAEAERKEKKAEDMRKKREAAKKEEERKLVARRKEEQKEKKKQEQAAAKAAAKEAEAKRKAEEAKLAQEQKKEEQRLASLAAVEAKKLEKAALLVGHAFEKDRLVHLSHLEGQGGADAVDIQNMITAAAPAGSEMLTALKRIAAVQEDIEITVDVALGCLATSGDAVASSMAALAVRPQFEAPEVNKEAKARMKKQRLRVRTAVTKYLQELKADTGAAAPSALAEPVASAAVPETASQEAISIGTDLLVEEDSVVYASLESYDSIGNVTKGQRLVAAGVPTEADGFTMVPVQPKGCVEARIVKVIPAPKLKAVAKGKSKAKAPKPAAAKKTEKKVDLSGKLLSYVQSAEGCESAGETVAIDLWAAFLGGFDLSPAAHAHLVEVEPVETAEAPAAKSKAGKKKKAAKAAEPEEDLDALLSEFGVEVKPTKSKKKGGK